MAETFLSSYLMDEEKIRPVGDIYFCDWSQCLLNFLSAMQLCVSLIN